MTDSNKPVCDYCDTPVYENFWYVINGDVLCRHCLNEFKVTAAGARDDEGDEDE